MRRLLAVVLWSVIAAAFIGPGTVTTCASAGAGFGTTLLWALTFSTVACYVLQEASARLTVLTGRDLGRAIRAQAGRGLGGGFVLALALGAILLGCAAYEAGNLLGAAAGAALALDVSPQLAALVLGALAAALLAAGTTRAVARAMSVLVAVMGIAFLVTASLLRPSPAAILHGLSVPAMPPESAMLVLGLVGTTVVPYNIFLGSGLAAGQRLGETRFGLAVAVGLGGLISMAILVVGTVLSGELTFPALAAVLASRLGGWAAWLFAAGLFAAGLSSAITAPLAAAITAKSLLDAEGSGWEEGSWRYRLVWAAVVLTGTFFGATGIRPIPAIILAQALNGVLLPVAAIFLLVVLNDRHLMGEHLASAWSNATLGVVTALTVLLGGASLVRAAATAFGLPPPSPTTLLGLGCVAAGGVAIPIVRLLLRRRAGAKPPG